MIRLVSSDLNGTLVHQHTMSDMIRLYVGKEQFQEVDVVFKKQTSGTATMEEAFSIAGPLTKGITLRQAIDYTTDQMKYLVGFEKFVGALHDAGICLVINSTGYSVTIYAIREQIGRDKIHGQIGNSLKFGLDADPQSTLREDELEEKVIAYFSDPIIVSSADYDNIRATGEINLGITDEPAKARLILVYAERHFPDMPHTEISHMGDTMGDGGGIVGIAKAGGIGIAFNYNDSLKRYLEDAVIRCPDLNRQIYTIDPKERGQSDLTRLIPIIKQPTT